MKMIIIRSSLTNNLVAIRVDKIQTIWQQTNGEFIIDYIADQYGNTKAIQTKEPIDILVEEINRA